MPADPQRALERRARAAAATPELLDALEAGAPLSTALDLFGVDRDLAGALADRPEVRRAVARRAIHLQDQLSSDDKGKRDAALVELERIHGWKKPPQKSIEEAFGELLHEFAELEPDAYVTLRRLIERSGETAAERRVKRRGKSQ